MSGFEDFIDSLELPPAPTPDHVVLSTARYNELLRAEDRLGAEITRLRARLEIPPSPISQAYDGISCRDETIAGLDARVAELQGRLAVVHEYIRTLEKPPGQDLVEEDRQRFYRRIDDLHAENCTLTTLNRELRTELREKIEHHFFQPLEKHHLNGEVWLLAWPDPAVPGEWIVESGWYEDGPADRCWYNTRNERVPQPVRLAPLGEVFTSRPPKSKE